MRIRDITQRSIHYLKRQTHDFKLMLVRRAMHGFGTSLVTQYSSLYATLLGASPVQLGSLQSVGNVVGAFAALPAGWFIDRNNLKRVFLVGSALLAASGVLNALAPSWIWLYAAVIIFYLGMRISCTACTVTCASELKNEERATGRGLCRTLAAPVTIVASLVSAWIVSRFGGISLTGIRPLYAIQAVVFVVIFLLVLTQLRSTAGDGQPEAARRLFSGFTQLFREGPDVARLMIVMGLMELPWSLTQPFMPVYAHEFKGATEFVLSGTTTAKVLLPMLASIPLGRLADRHGRKKLLLAIAPFTYVANLLLILAPSSGPGATLCVIGHGLLFGLNSVGMAIASSMVTEIMPQRQMGRWIGLVSLFRGLMSIPAPMLGGLIWEHIGPQYVFLAAIVIDLCFRLPLLAASRETLHLDKNAG